MKENIETKDVQRTEYLDKNGLDMLWAKVKENTHNQVEVERNRAVAKENNIVDTKADKSALDNYVLTTALAEYAKKTDIPAIDTSDFVSKTTTDAQIINSILGIVGGPIQMLDYTEDGDTVTAVLASTGLEFDGSDRSTIELNASDVNSNNRSRIIIEAYNENPEITLQGTIGSDYAFQNNLTITNEGISSTDNNANHVFATDGSIADLTQYAKKSEITAGGNVDDVQVNGVSVVENKIANIKPATKESLGVVKVGDGLNVTDGTISVDSTAIGAGNYIPYARYENGEYIMLNNICVESAKTKSLIGSNVLSVCKMANNGIHSNIQCAEIELQSDKNRVRINDDGIDIWKLDDFSVLGISDHLLGLSNRGITLHGGDNNHVLTSNASTIDITQYVLKSVYDEKIAALEARIAALEAKHTETA